MIARRKGAEAPATPRRNRHTESTAETASVNLLSPWVLEELRVLRLRKRFAVGTVALVLALGLAWTGITLQLRQAEADLQGEEAVESGLSRQISALDDVRSYIATVEQRTTTTEAMFDAQAQLSLALDELNAALPRRAEFDTLVIELASQNPADNDQEFTCPGPDPFGATTVIGCVQLSGTAPTRTDVSQFVQQLAESQVFVEPFVETTTKGDEPGVTFTGTVGLTPAARYEDPTDDEDAGTASDQEVSR